MILKKSFIIPKIEIMENTISKFIQTGLHFQHFHSKSVSQIQKELLKPKSKPIANVFKLSTTNNIADMKIISPFYPRPIPCKEKRCACPFHRRIKIQAMMAKKSLSKAKCVQTVQNSPNKSKDQQRSQQQKRIYKSFLRQNKLEKQKTQLITAKETIYPRIKSFNQQLNQFLQDFDLLLLKKGKNQNINSHIIKTSVGQIFKYIYSHVDQKKEVVQNHIENIQKDKDFTRFYIEKFIDLKTKYQTYNKAKTKSNQKLKLSFHQGKSRGSSRRLQEERSKFTQKRQVIKRRVTKGKQHQKLLIQQLIQDVDCGEQLSSVKILELSKLDVQKFEENCNFLTNQLTSMDNDVLEEIRNEIVYKILKILSQQPQSESNLIKRGQMRKIISLINGKLKEIHSSRQSSRSSKQDNQSYISLTKKNSQYRASPRSISKRGSIYQESVPQKSGFSQENSRFFNELTYATEESDSNLEQSEPTQQKLDSKRTKQKGNTIIIPDTQYIVKKGKLKLAKYRRLSHDVFFHKLILTEEEDDMTLSKNNIIQDKIIEKLEFMSMELSELKIMKKEIESKIKQHKLHNLLIQECDSLLTAKRKIGVFKKLLKEEAFNDDMKIKIEQYLALTEQESLIKNKNWATKKIKDSFRLDQDNVQMFNQQQQQDKQSFLKSILKQIFKNQQTLKFFDIKKIIYQEPELNFEQHFMEVNTKIQHRDKKRKTSVKIKFPLLQKKSLIEMDSPPKQESLIQVGLKNNGPANCFFDQLGQLQNSHKKSRIPQIMENNENKYLNIIHKLKLLKK